MRRTSLAPLGCLKGLDYRLVLDALEDPADDVVHCRLSGLDLNSQPVAATLEKNVDPVS